MTFNFRVELIVYCRLINAVSSRIENMVYQVGPFGKPSFRRRLKDAKELLGDDLDGVKASFVNLFQTVKYMGVSRNGIIPRLLRRSFIYDLVTDRELIALQHLLIQGYPVPLLTPYMVRISFFDYTN